MENASKALIMASEILVGVIILGIIVFLFTSFRDYSKINYDRIEETEIAQFNAQFLKYEGKTCTAHDVMTVVNLAQENNQRYGLDEEKASDGSFYIQVEVKKGPTITPISKYPTQNLEKWNNEGKTNFLEQSSKAVIITENINGKEEKNAKQKYEYKCEVLISEVSKRVNHIVFSGIENK